MRTSLPLFAVTLLVLAPSGASAQKITYDDHVKPIFRAKCFGCHNTNKKSSDLDLTTYTAVMQGGAAGASIEPGSVTDSYLFSLVNHEDEPKMPPNSEKIEAASIDTIRKWIEGGALENSSSKAMKKKAGPDLTLSAPATGRPEGAPPLPDVVGLKPVVLPAGGTAVEAIATSPWAPLIAVSSQQQVVLYHSTDLQPLAVLPFPEGVPEVLRFSRNGKLLLAGGGRGAYQGKVIVWDVKTGKRVLEIGDEVDSVLAADISSDFTLVALGGPGRTVRVYNTSDGSLNYEIKKHTDWVYDVEFSPDSVFLATADRQGGLHVWEAFNGRLYLTLAGHRGGVTSVSWRQDSNLLASGSMDNNIKLWEMENGRNVRNWGAHSGGVMSVEFCRDGQIVSCGRDRVTKLWNGNGQQVRAFEAFSDLALKVSYCDETKRVIAGDWTGNIRVWNAADGARVGELAQNPPSLEQRLQAAQADLAAKQKDHAAKAAASATATKNRDNMKTALAASQKLMNDSKALNAQAVQQVPVLTKAQQAAQQALKAATDTQTALTKAVPQLKTAADQIKVAAAAVPEDKELAALVASLQKKHTEKAQLLTTTQALVKTRTTEQTAATARLAAMQKQQTSSAAAMKKAQADITSQTAALKPLEEAAGKATGALNAAVAARDAATASVTRWTNYIALDKELAALKATESTLEEKQVAAAEMAEQLQTAQAALTEATEAMNKATASHQAKVAEAAKLKQALAAMNTEVTNLGKQAATLDAGLPKMQAGHATMTEAAKLVPGDKEIAAVVAQLKTLLDSKTAAVASLKQAATAKAAEAKKTTETMNTAVAKSGELQKAVAAAKQKVDKMTQDMQPIAKKADAANQDVATAKQAVEAAEKVVESRRVLLRPLLNIKTASR